MLSEIQVAVDVGSTRHRVAIGAPDGELLASSTSLTPPPASANSSGVSSVSA